MSNCDAGRMRARPVCNVQSGTDESGLSHRSNAVISGRRSAPLSPYGVRLADGKCRMKMLTSGVRDSVCNVQLAGRKSVTAYRARPRPGARIKIVAPSTPCDSFATETSYRPFQARLDQILFILLIHGFVVRAWPRSGGRYPVTVFRPGNWTLQTDGRTLELIIFIQHFHRLVGHRRAKAERSFAR